METPIKYHLADDGIGIWVRSGEKGLKQISRSDHLLHKAIVAPDEVFNRGVKRGNAILVTGDRPRFALARTLPENSPGPDLIKLGDGRVRLECEGVGLWLDECPDIATLFNPGSTEYELSSPYFPGLRMRLAVAQASDWGLTARLTMTNQRSQPIELKVEWVFGGVGRHGRTWRPTYFPADADDGAGNASFVLGDVALVHAETIPDWAGATTRPGSRPIPVNGRVRFAQDLHVAPAESQACYLIAGHAGATEQLQALLGAADPEALMAESRRYYDDMLAQAVIATPSPILDLAFRTSVWNLDSTYTAPAWIEGVHWWSAPWVNLFQISAAISLGQYERARQSLLFFSQAGYGMIMASGQAGGWPPPDVLYYYPYDGLFYYIYELCQYFDHTGDRDLVEQMWPSLVATLAQVLAERDPDGDGLLSWRLGCNAFLYQADQLGMPGSAASPSLMAAGMIERLAGLSQALGWETDASHWQAQAERIYAQLPRLWNRREGVFYNHIDWQGLAHSAHYYTDLIFPALYANHASALPKEAIWQSLAHLHRTLIYRTTHSDPRLNLTLMRVGDLKPSMFGNDNVLPAQMAETARACFRVGDHESGCALLEAVALAATLYTEAPGNFPERLDDTGKGEFNYLFGHPIASFAYSVIGGLFGLALVDEGQTLTWQPGFPAAWDHAELKLPYAHVTFNRTTSDEHVTERYRMKCDGRNLIFSVFLEPCRIREVLCNGQPIAYTLAPDLGTTKLTLAAPQADVCEVVITHSPLPLILGGPSSAVAGESMCWSLRSDSTPRMSIERVEDPQGLLRELSVEGHQVWGVVDAEPGHYQLFAYVHEPPLVYPIPVEVHPAFQVWCSSAIYDAEEGVVRLGLHATTRQPAHDGGSGADGYRLRMTWRNQTRVIALPSASAGPQNCLFASDRIPAAGVYDLEYALLSGEVEVHSGSQRLRLLGSDENTQARMEAERDARTLHLDLRPFYSSETMWVTSKWRRENKALDLGGLYDSHDPSATLAPMRTPAGVFLAPPTGARLAMVEFGRSEPFTRRTETFGFPSSLTIPVGMRATMLSLLYASEVESRLTGSCVGTLRLEYADGRSDEIRLEVGKQIDTLYSHWATEAIPVAIGHKQDYLNVLDAPCDPSCILEAFTISLFAADVEIGLIGANVIAENDNG